VMERLLQHQPVGRLDDPREVAGTVLWLCLDRASFVETAICVDGGYLAVQGRVVHERRLWNRK